ncbi:DUF3043 domain-containing protein [Streptomonospora litoralis]|uniref:DUF3043 domain-containing protein n=1 Tax=Streptomonospora litoralis TaxID=2498135 RepID=UPI0010365EBD|nr:DUF3043 domain-containing protein [Streptomonospora litoralis]
MFRRRTVPATEDPAASGPATAEATQPKGYTPKKGAPTPKRSESEQTLRRPLNAPRTRKEAYRAYRDRQASRSRRPARQGGSAPGEDRHYRPQDYGPVRAYARDVVDSRRSVSEFFLYFSLAIIVLLFMPSPQFQLVVTYVVWPAMMVTIIAEGIYIGNRVKRQARELFPGDKSVRGVGMYSAMRQLQIRRLRLPKPRVKPGQAVPAPER